MVLHCRGVVIADHRNSAGAVCYVQYDTHGNSRFVQSSFLLVAFCCRFWWGTVGDEIVVQVMEIDDQGRIKLSRKDALADIEAKKNAK